MIAAELNLTRAEVYGVVSFYHDFRREPPGRHVIKLCRAEACQAMGGEALAARAEQRLGVPCGTTREDGEVSLENIYCLGLCATAPSALIDGRPVGRLSTAKLDRLLTGAGAVTRRLYLPRDAAAIAVGADDVAEALAQAAAAAGQTLDMMRTGSRGMLWLEPLLEIEIDGVRHAFGPLEPDDVDGPASSRLLAGDARAAACPSALARADGADPLLRAPDAADLRSLRRHRSGVARRLSRRRRLRRPGLARWR